MLISDAQPGKFFMVTPQREKENLALKDISLKDQESGQDRKAYEVAYKPPGPGDYYLCLESPPCFIPEDQVFWQDYVKEPLHVVTAKGWDQPVGLPVEIVPLTRPYGWPAGSVFKGQALARNLPLTRAVVEIEKFNEVSRSPGPAPQRPPGRRQWPPHDPGDQDRSVWVTSSAPWTAPAGGSSPSPPREGKGSTSARPTRWNCGAASGFTWNRPRRPRCRRGSEEDE